MWQFIQAIDGMRDACAALDLAVVSGNVSFYNETDGQAIPPTPTVALVGVMDDVTQHVTQWFKQSGDIVVLLGETHAELGASEYLAVIHNQECGVPPQLESGTREAAPAGLLTGRSGKVIFASAHDVAEGGLAVALAEACIS